MSNATTTRPARSRAEQTAIDHLVARLGREYPELTDARIARAVHERYEQFDGSPIRDFIPVLVERAVRAELREGARSA